MTESENRINAAYTRVEGSKFAPRQFVGPPPGIDLGDERHPLAPADLIVMFGRDEGIVLERFTEEGEPVGDTWHQSADDAFAQAEAEYGAERSSWIEIPQHVGDPVEYALRLVTGQP